MTRNLTDVGKTTTENKIMNTSNQDEESDMDLRDSKYIVEKNPHDKKWYAMGHVGSNKWMPVSDGFKSKAQAQTWAKSQGKVDKATRGELAGI